MEKSPREAVQSSSLDDFKSRVNRHVAGLV